MFSSGGLLLYVGAARRLQNGVALQLQAAIRAPDVSTAGLLAAAVVQPGFANAIARALSSAGFPGVAVSITSSAGGYSTSVAVGGDMPAGNIAAAVVLSVFGAVMFGCAVYFMGHRHGRGKEVPGGDSYNASPNSISYTARPNTAREAASNVGKRSPASSPAELVLRSSADVEATPIIIVSTAKSESSPPRSPSPSKYSLPATPPAQRQLTIVLNGEGRLGMQFHNVEGRGVTVHTVSSTGLAAAAGLMPGDTLLDLGGEPLSNLPASAVVRMLLSAPRPYTITVARAVAAAAEEAQPPASPYDGQFAGSPPSSPTTRHRVTLNSAGPLGFTFTQMPGSRTVSVTAVAAGSAAAAAGLAAGDELLAAAGAPLLGTLSAVSSQLSQRPVELIVQRRGGGV